MSENQATEMLRRYSNDECSPVEKEFIDAWYNELVKTGECRWQDGEKEMVQTDIENRLLQQIAEEDASLTSSHPRTRVVSVRTWWAAAAVFVVVAGAGYFIVSKPKPARPITKTETLLNDVAPGGNKAVLTLANGKTIVLDDAANGKLAQEGNATVTKPDDGKLVYALSNEAGNAPAYNILTTPRSGQYQLVLPDGSKVWLNAESSIRYPVAFTGNERRVVITGEAYFEVAHNPRLPFVVEKGDMEVQVLGTHFNVNAYENEKAIKTTLLEGSVKVVNRESSIGSNTSVLLKPGEQAIATAHSPLTINHSPDADGVVAWKNGLFHFENADIKTVMRQLARWYDVEVEYKRANMENDPLFVEVSRNTRLSDVLKVLEESGSARFNIQGKKIIVN